MTHSRTFLFSLYLLAPLSVVAQSQFDVFEASIAEIRDALDGGQVSSVQLVQQYLDRNPTSQPIEGRLLLDLSCVLLLRR
jgi:hypothetical protein